MTFQSIINKRIKDGRLPKELKKLPTHSFKELDNHQIVYIPRGLTWEQWDELLKGTCNGLWHSSLYNDEPFGTSIHWDVEQVYCGDRPSEMDISYTEANKKYKKLLSVESYLALQWNALELGKEPVDGNTWSWLQNEPELGLGDLRAPRGDWGPGDGQVCVSCDDVGDRGGDLGVRLPRVGEDLDLSTSSVPSWPPERLEIEGVMYVREV